MEKKEFNLLDEPWICVVHPDSAENMVSLKDVFLHAHEYADLSGELPAQDIAMLRFLLAVLHVVFSRVDETGADAPLEEEKDAYKRWRTLWELGRFPEKPIVDYLERWRDRFYLFHPTHPFWQVQAAAEASGYSAAKLNGELMESANKLRLFSTRSGVDKDRLSFAEAARWLLFSNGFDDAGFGRPKSGTKRARATQGWLGKLGLISAKGENLFETLLLNFVLLDGGEPWESCTPIWEREEAGDSIWIEVLCPNDQAALLTLQSRRLLLRREGDVVTGFHRVPGDILEAKDMFAEQMTMWEYKETVNKKRFDAFRPKAHDRSRRIWQDFASIMTAAAAAKDGDKKHTPGVVDWIGRLAGEDCLHENQYVSLRIVSVSYDDNGSSIVDSFEDSLTFHRDLLSGLGEAWVNCVEIEVRECETLAGYIADLALSLHYAEAGKKQGDAGKNEEKNVRNQAKEQFFYRVDVPFRDWLRSLDPSQDDGAREERRTAWRDQIRTIAKRLGEELVEQVGPAAFRGRLVKKDEKDKKGKKGKKGRQEENNGSVFYSAPRAYSFFQARLNRWYRGENA